MLDQTLIDRLLFSNTDIFILCVVMPFVLIIGLFGNCLTVYVFIRGRGMQSVTNMLLVNLAMADILFLLATVLPKLCSYIAAPVPFVNDYVYVGDIGCRALSYLSDVTLAVSCMTILILAIEKYLAIRWYVKFRVYRTTNNTLIVCLVVWVFCLMYMIPDTFYLFVTVYHFCWPKSYPNHDKMPSFIYVCDACYTEGCVFFTAYYQFGQVLFLIMIPALLCIYVLILFQLNKTERSSKNITAKASYKAKKQLIRMLVVTTAVFIICIGPYRIFAFLIFYDVPVNFSVRNKLLNTFRTLTYINSAANPIIYNTLCDRYRQAFKETLLACLPKRLFVQTSMATTDANGGTMTTLTMRNGSRKKKSCRC
ncbi:allatostatin-A receptor-like [Glandiceps talaboti]